MSNATCTTCGHPAASPFRAYAADGKVLSGCVDAAHDGELLAVSESSRWHNRPEAKRIRRQAAKMWGERAAR